MNRKNNPLGLSPVGTVDEEKSGLVCTGWDALFKAGTPFAVDGKRITGLMVDGEPLSFAAADFITVHEGRDLSVKIFAKDPRKTRKR